MIHSRVLPGLRFRVDDLIRRPAHDTLRDDPVYADYVLPGLRAAEERAAAEARRADDAARRADDATRRATLEAQARQAAEQRATQAAERAASEALARQAAEREAQEARQALARLQARLAGRAGEG